jgi:hypothetical protein
MRTLAFLPVAIAALGCGSQVYWDDRADENSGPPERCGDPGTMAITGTVGGVPVQIDAPFSGMATSEGIIALAQPSGATAIFTPQTFFPDGDPDPSTSFYAGSTPSAVATIQPTPVASGPLSGICDAGDPVVTFTLVEENSLFHLNVTTRLASLRRLGVCPGAPVDAKLSLSFDPNTPSILLTGTVGGTSFQANFYEPIFGSSSVPGASPAQAGFFKGGGLLQQPPDASLPAILVMPAGSPDPGAVYCVGGYEDLDGGAVTVLTNLSRIGTCADAPPLSGSLSICIAFHD